MFEILSGLKYRYLRLTSTEYKLLSLAFANISDSDPLAMMLGMKSLSRFLFKIPEFISIRKQKKNIANENIRRVLDVVDRQFPESLHLKELEAISGTPFHNARSNSRKSSVLHWQTIFPSSNYFCTVFLNYTHCTPAEFHRACCERMEKYAWKGTVQGV